MAFSALPLPLLLPLVVVFLQAPAAISNTKRRKRWEHNQKHIACCTNGETDHINDRDPDNPEFLPNCNHSIWDAPSPVAPATGHRVTTGSRPGGSAAGPAPPKIMQIGQETTW